MANMAQLRALAAAARQSSGTPQKGAIAGDALSPDDLLLKLRSGQVSAGALLQLLAMIAGMGAQGPGQMMQGPPQGGGNPIQDAMMQGGGGGGAPPGM